MTRSPEKPRTPPLADPPQRERRDTIQQLLVGRAQFVVSQDTEVAYRELQDPGKFEVVFVMPAEDFEPYSAYLRKDNAETAKVAAAVKAILDDGTLMGIVEQWKLSPSQLDGIGK